MCASSVGIVPFVRRHRWCGKAMPSLCLRLDPFVCDGRRPGMNAAAERLGFEQWLETYQGSQRELLHSDPEFERWLDEEYVPVAGAWMY
jgi:hypothetical protein